MRDILITKLDYSYTNIYKSFFQSISKYNKYFNIIENKKIFIVNNGSIDLGVILLSEDYGYFNVEIFQAPRVCRLSIISLIECSVILAKKSENKLDTINFKLNGAASYNFKFKLLFKEFIELEDCIQVSSDILNELTEEDITFRNITFSEF